MTEREAMRYLLHHPTGPFDSATWEHVKQMFEKPKTEESWIEQRIRCVGETYFKEAGLTVCIPRVDLNTVRRNLKRMNAIFVEDYDEKKQQAIVRESKTSPAISDSIILCKDY